MGELEIVGFVAAVTTIGQFLAGSLVVKNYINNKSTGESSCLPFTCGYLSSSLWLSYGLMKDDNTISLVNTVGVITQIIYVLVYFLITMHKKYIIYQFIAACFTQLMIMVYINAEENIQSKLECMGFISSLFTLIFIAAPLTKLFYVIRVKSTESLPYPVILSCFFVSLLWFIYGTLSEDKYIIVTNLLGCILASVQLCLFLIFPSVPTVDTLKLIRDA